MYTSFKWLAYASGFDLPTQSFRFLLQAHEHIGVIILFYFYFFFVGKIKCYDYFPTMWGSSSVIPYPVPILQLWGF